MQTDENTNSENTGNDSLIVISKIKKFIKEQQQTGINVSQSFFPLVDQDVKKALDDAIGQAKKMGRKTVMGRDFSFYKDDPKVENILVVAAKIKKYIKEHSEGFNTSAQVMEQLTLRVQQICFLAIKKAVDDKRKTVMDRDFTSPTAQP